MAMSSQLPQRPRNGGTHSPAVGYFRNAWAWHNGFKSKSFPDPGYTP